MHITVTCKTCQKRYKVDAKFGGKKLKCKACGGAVAVPVVEAPADSDDGLMADLTAAAAAEQQAPAAPAARENRSQAPRAAPRAPRQPQRMPVAPDPESGGGEMDFAASPCPRCGRPLTGSVRYCAACGFDRQAAAPVEAAPPAAAPLSRGIQRHWTDESQTDSRGFRINQPYANPILDLLDTWVPKLAQWLVLAVTVLYVVFLWHGALNSPAAAMGLLSYGALILITFLYCIFVSLTLLINLSITTAGINLGARIMKCQLPENPWRRLLATYLVPGVVAFAMLYAMGSSLDAVRSSRSDLAPAAAIVAVLTALAVFLAASFFTFMFFFRLKILENLVCYVFFVVFNILSWIASWIVLLAIAWILAKILTTVGRSVGT